MHRLVHPLDRIGKCFTIWNLFAAFTAANMIIVGGLNASWQIPAALGIWTSAKLLFDVWESFPHRAAHSDNTSHGAARLGRIYGTSNLSGQEGWKPWLWHLRSSSSMSLNQARSLSPNRRAEPVENEHGTFWRHNYRKLFSAGVDKVEIAGRKMPGNGYVVGEICRMKNLFPFHPWMDCQDSHRYVKWIFLLGLNIRHHEGP